MICATCHDDRPWSAFTITRPGGVVDLARWCERCRDAWHARRASSPRALGTNSRARGTNPRARGTNPRAFAEHWPRPARMTFEELVGPLPAATVRRYPDTRPRRRQRRRNR